MVKSPNGWWFVENDDQHGWVPGTYLEPKVGIEKKALSDKIMSFNAI